MPDHVIIATRIVDEKESVLMLLIGEAVPRVVVVKQLVPRDDEMPQVTAGGCCGTSATDTAQTDNGLQ